MQIQRFLLMNLDKRKPKNGESYHQFTAAFNRLLNLYANSAATASRYIGGLHVANNHRGDVGEKAGFDSGDGRRTAQGTGFAEHVYLLGKRVQLPETLLHDAGG